VEPTGKRDLNLLGKASRSIKNIFLTCIQYPDYLPACYYNKVHILIEPFEHGEIADRTPKDPLLPVSKPTGSTVMEVHLSRIQPSYSSLY
jgi:hypothetical protein